MRLAVLPSIAYRAGMTKKTKTAKKQVKPAKKKAAKKPVVKAASRKTPKRKTKPRALVRTRLVNFKVTSEQHRKLRKLARADRSSKGILSAFVRGQVLGKSANLTARA